MFSYFTICAYRNMVHMLYKNVLKTKFMKYKYYRTSKENRVQLSKVFRVLGDDTRLRILSLLTKESLCVCQISETLKISQPSASKHLSRLCSAGIIACRRISQWCFYSFSDSFKTQYQSLHTFLLQSFLHDELYTGDKRALNLIIESNLCCREVLEKLRNDKK